MLLNASEIFFDEEEVYDDDDDDDDDDDRNDCTYSDYNIISIVLAV